MSVHQPDNIFQQEEPRFRTKFEEEHCDWPMPEIPERVRGELRFAPVTIAPGESESLQRWSPGCFWPEHWRVESDSPLGQLFLRRVVLGVQMIYPNTHNPKPMFCSRGEGEAIDAFRARHNHEGCPVAEAAAGSSLAPRILPPDTATQWTFENKSGDPITFVLVLEGLEVP